MKAVDLTKSAESSVLTDQELERFWSKVEKTDTCWLWAAGKTNVGYGAFGSRRIGTLTAHTLSFVLAGGTLVKGMRVDHTCYVRHCVNPAHLRLITHKQNIENRSGLNANNKSGYRGVFWDKGRNKWRAEVVHHEKTLHVGRFDSKEAAVEAVIAKRNELFTHNDLDKV